MTITDTINIWELLAIISVAISLLVNVWLCVQAYEDARYWQREGGNGITHILTRMALRREVMRVVLLIGLGLLALIWAAIPEDTSPFWASVSLRLSIIRLAMTILIMAASIWDWYDKQRIWQFYTGKGGRR